MAPVLDLRSEGAKSARIEVRNLFREDRISTVQSGFYSLLDGNPKIELSAEEGASGRSFSHWTLVTKHGKFTAPTPRIEFPGNFTAATETNAQSAQVSMQDMSHIIAHYT